MALTYTTKEYRVPCTLRTGTPAVNFDGIYKMVIIPDNNSMSYGIDVIIRFDNKGTGWNWRGRQHLYVAITWNGSDPSVSPQWQNAPYPGEFIITPANGTDDEDEIYTYSFSGISAIGVDSIRVYIRSTVDRVECAYCHNMEGPGTKANGTHHNGYDHDHYDYISLNEVIDVTSVPLISAPVISNLKNTNPYNGKTGISASENSISLSWDINSDGGDPGNIKSFYNINENGQSESGWIQTSSTESHTIKGLKPGTFYTIRILTNNSKLSSNVLPITIRTRHSNPIANVSLDSRDLETLTINWDSDKSLKSTEYKIDSGEWISLGQTGKEGKFTAQWFNPKTEHTIYFRGTSIDDLDALPTGEKNVKGTTLDRSHINSETIITPGYDGKSIVFGMPINIPIARESTKPCKIKIWANANGRNPEFIFENIAPTTSTFTFTPTQDQLDQLYKCYTNENQITLYFLIYTYSDRYKNYYWPDVNSDGSERSQNKVLILTGIAKTAHVGVNNNPRRAQVWVGGPDGKPHRAVSWVGVNNLPRRCI